MRIVLFWVFTLIAVLIESIEKFNNRFFLFCWKILLFLLQLLKSIKNVPPDVISSCNHWNIKCVKEIKYLKGANKSAYNYYMNIKYIQ